MQFTSSTLLLAGASLLASATADGVFSINGTAVPGDNGNVALVVLNGNIGDAPVCNGTAPITTLPASGGIACNAGYSLTFTWATQNAGIQATYGTPSAAPFTYSVPETSTNGTTYIFGFQDIFPSAQAAADFVSKKEQVARRFRA